MGPILYSLHVEGEGTIGANDLDELLAVVGAVRRELSEPLQAARQTIADLRRQVAGLQQDVDPTWAGDYQRLKAEHAACVQARDQALGQVAELGGELHRRETMRQGALAEVRRLRRQAGRLTRRGKVRR